MALRLRSSCSCFSRDTMPFSLSRAISASLSLTRSSAEITYSFSYFVLAHFGPFWRSALLTLTLLFVWQGCRCGRLLVGISCQQLCLHLLDGTLHAVRHARTALLRVRLSLAILIFVTSLLWQRRLQCRPILIACSNGEANGRCKV